jgi:uncharacterized protein (DUF58 family)
MGWRLRSHKDGSATSPTAGDVGDERDRIAVEVTAAGWATIVLGAAAYIVAWRAGWTEFAVVAAAALLAWALVAITVPRRSSLVTTRTLEPDRVTVGEVAIGSLVVRNGGRRRSQRVLAVDTVAGDAVELPVDALAAGDVLEVPYTIPTHRRGVLPVGPLTIDRTDPLGLVRARRSVGQRSALWVRPRIHELRAPLAGWARDIDGATADLSPQGTAAFHTLREYQPGDDLRRVHWRSTARLNRLMVRHDVDIRRAQQLVILDTTGERYVPPTDGLLDAVPRAGDVLPSFEVAVSVVASVAAAGLRAEHPTSVLLGIDEAASGVLLSNLGDVLDGLTEVVPSLQHGRALPDRTGAQHVDVRSFEAVLAAAQRHGGAVGTVIVVTGDVDDREVGLAVARRRVGDRLVVVRAVPRPSTGPAVRARMLDRTTVLLDVSDAAELAGPWTGIVTGARPVGAGR